MKKKILTLTLGILAALTPLQAQIFSAINTIGSVISPALSGSGNYKGYVEAGYSHTIGKYNGDFIELNTTQGYQYNNWFFMGAGLGIDLLLSHPGSNWNNGMQNQPPNFNGSTQTAPMLPLYADFRFLIGGAATSNISFFLDLKVGCSFLLTNKIIAIGDGYLTNRQYFFLNPAIGLRLPFNKKNPKQAIDVGVRYKLLTSEYWYNYSNNITLQGIGAFIAFEW